MLREKEKEFIGIEEEKPNELELNQSSSRSAGEKNCGRKLFLYFFILHLLHSIKTPKLLQINQVISLMNEEGYAHTMTCRKKMGIIKLGRG